MGIQMSVRSQHLTHCTCLTFFTSARMRQQASEDVYFIKHLILLNFYFQFHCTQITWHAASFRTDQVVKQNVNVPITYCK